MQDMTTSICSAVTTPTAADYSDTPEVQLVDNRDGKIYWVAKLKDGHCWMTQNLDHDIVAEENYYTPANTDISVSWTAENATIKTIASNGSFTGWTADSSNPYSADPGEWYWTDVYYNDACNSNPWCRYTNPSANNTTLEKFSHTPYIGNGVHGHVGNYYNWTAAIASNDSSNITDFNDTNTSICPANWRLPSARNNEFSTLLTSYDALLTDGTTRDQQLTGAPLYFVRSGNVDGDGGPLYYGGYSGSYWSSTNAGSTVTARYLRFLYNSITPQSGIGRGVGLSVRCLAR